MLPPKIEGVESSAERAAFVGHYSPELNSKPARRLADFMRDQAGEGDCDLEHAERVVGYVDLFGRTKRVRGQVVSMPVEVYDAALLYENCDALSMESEKYDLMRRGLEECVSEWGIDRAAVVLDMVKDVSSISEFTSQYATQSIPEEIDWDMSSPGVDWERLKDMVKSKIRPEAFLIKGAELMDRIKSPSTDDRETLQYIFEIESCIYPALDTLGYTAFAEELVSSCRIYRMRRQGRHDLVGEAERRYEAVKDVDPMIIARDIFGLSDDVELSWIVNQSDETGDRGVNCRFARIDLGETDGHPVWIAFRQKEKGSMAKKLAESTDSYQMLDDFGYMIVIGDDNPGRETDQCRVLTSFFNDLVDRVKRNPSARPARTKPDRKPFYVQGSPQFVDALENSGLSADEDVEKNSINDDNSPYSVAKVSMLYRYGAVEVPVEVQCLTGAFYYWDNKLGANYHGFYKGNGLKDDTDQAKAVYHRVGFSGLREMLYSLDSSTPKANVVRQLMAGLAINSDFQT